MMDFGADKVAEPLCRPDTGWRVYQEELLARGFVRPRQPAASRGLTSVSDGGQSMVTAPRAAGGWWEDGSHVRLERRVWGCWQPRQVFYCPSVRVD
jgi:hypothetical protein